MRNFAIGSEIQIDGRSCIQTHQGAPGHAVFGPYQQLEPGRYAVEFTVSATEGQSFTKDFVCAVVDVAVAGGNKIVTSRPISFSSLRDGPFRVALTFELGAPERAEFRVGVNGKASLVIDEYRPLTKIPDGNSDLAVLLDASRFPEPDLASAPPFFTAHEAILRQLYEQGAAVHILDGTVVLRMKDVSFLARDPDDLNLVGEIFHENMYNLLTANDTCVIDIGLNIGLVSLLFAAKDSVREVHAFEPFPETYQRAQANLAINPDLAAKIRTYNVGLSDGDSLTTLMMPSGSPSGSLSLEGLGGDVPVEIAVRDAATMLAPIFAEARGHGRDIVMKVDCEGSEFAIFETLEAADMLKHVSAFMVEWHSIFAGKTQATLIAPLLRAGFIVFDQSKPAGNGFFYAVRADRGPAS
jgi:FkbM family methyltransferase